MVVYISCDIETDGPVPNPYSMLQLGAASFNENGELLSTFSSNLKELPGGKQCKKTMEWWKSQNGLYEKTREDTIEPKEAMELFHLWVMIRVIVQYLLLIRLVLTFHLSTGI